MDFRDVARRTLRQGLDLAYPPRCVGCGAFETFLCQTCVANAARASGPDRCPNCGARWDQPLNCPACAHWDRRVSAAAVFLMEGAPRQAVHALKYSYARALAPVMAGHMAELRKRARFDVALAVPLHRSRERERGFNQSELLLEHLGWPRTHGRLVRRRKTGRQVGQDLAARRSNVLGAFAYEGVALTGLRVGLVDDVVTTGATANECAKLLFDHGAREVVVLAFARASEAQA